ncbi:MAG: hypothetical protein ACYDA9_18835 [Terriglobia bacterium]
MKSRHATAFLLILTGFATIGMWRPGPRSSSGQKKMLAAQTPVQVPTEHLDIYGGVPIRVSEPAKSFRVKKVGDRWLFVTPAGNAFWMLGVYAVDTQDSVDDRGETYSHRIVSKYGDKYTWAKQTVKRLKAWGFNTIGEYSTWYVFPTKSPFTDWANPERMPFVTMIRPSYYGLTNQHHYAKGPFKDLVAGTDPAIYTDWRGSTTPDVFDPNFEEYVNGSMSELTSDVLNSPWLIGIATDDADDLYGFGPGPDAPAARLHAHIGWLVLTGNFQQTRNSKLGVSYTDPKVYSKYALRDFLRKKYSTIEALNHAWGSNYTSWDSDGGWPSGRGFLDESGRNPWVGKDSGRLKIAAPAVRSDLDDFLYVFARKYFSIVSSAIKKRSGSHLVFGPAALNGWGGLTRPQILRAAGQYLDVLQAGISSQQILDLTARYAGDIPIVTWEGMVANPDSDLWRYPNPPEGVEASQSQGLRGQAYAQRASFLYEAKTSAGIHQICGLKFWAYVDSWGEKQNWGLVSFSDNAYDGKEAVRSGGTDPWGFRVGGEERDYGDFISSVRRANLGLIHSLHTEEYSAQSRAPKAPVASAAPHS